MKKILIIGMTSTPGGVESFLKNYCMNDNFNDIQFDFLCPSIEEIAYTQEIKEKSKIFYIVPKRKNMLLHKKQLNGFFRVHACEYVAVWANLNSLMNVDYLLKAKKYGIGRLIVHSHNSNNMGGLIQKILHIQNRMRIHKIATDYWACSLEAAKWFYPENLLSHVNYIKNAIKVSDFVFCQAKRETYREKYKLDNCKVIGHIGRLHFQKNQEFLLSIMDELVKRDTSYRLLLIGSGPDCERLKSIVLEKKLEEYIIFLGQQRDIGGWLSAFDLFVFPSKFEGLSIVALEAQANGVPIVASTNAICEEGLLNSNVSRISLESNIDVWCSAIEEAVNSERISSQVIQNNFKKNNFDIDIAISKLKTIFEDM